MVENLKEKILAYALKNALEHEGKCMQGNVINALFHEGLKREEIKDISKIINEQINFVNSINLEEQKKEFDNLKGLISKRETRGEDELPRIPNVIPGKIVTRIPPEPSKYNHIGHAISFLFNYSYAKEYNGKCILRFEDTNPEKVSQEYVDAMKTDVLEYLDIKPDEIRYVSDDMEKLYSYAEQLINTNNAYICFCEQEKLRELRHKGKECEHRNQTKEENMKYWKEMLNGKYKEGEVSLRLKGDMSSLNQVMRDPVLFRIIEAPHYRLKNKYRVWPMYDFYNPIEDGLCKITHILRSNEFEQRIELQDKIKDLLNLPKQTITQYGRFQVLDAVTQGREIRELIESGKYIGWDDPRLVTLRALKRRGIVKETYYELLKHIGISKKSATLDFNMIASINRKIIDPIADRYSCVFNPIKLKIKNNPKISEIKVKIHPLKEEERTIKINNEVYISKEDFNANIGKEVRLMNLYNIKIINEKEAEFLDDNQKNIPKINWVSEGINVKIMMPDAEMIEGFSEKAVEKLKVNDLIQFERFGFLRVDEIKKDKIVFWFSHK